LAKGRIVVLSPLAAANAFVRREGWQAHSPVVAGKQCAMNSCVGTLQ